MQIPFAVTKVYFYTLIGYYIEYNVDIKKISKKIFLGLISLSILGIIISGICTIYEAKLTNKYTQNYVQLFDYVTTITFFIIIKYATVEIFEISKNEKLCNLFCFLGSLTFGIYLIDPYLKMVLWNSFNKYFDDIFPTIIVSFFWIVVSMSLGGFITVILRKNKFFKKIL